MKQKACKSNEERDRLEPTPPNGKDEMNLAEFPFATLRTRGDSRKAIIYDGWVVDKDGNRHEQKWIVQGGSLVGLPTEYDERVYVALMAITVEKGFEKRKAPFSVYQILRIMGVGLSQREYRNVENSLDRLAGVTIKSEGAFWDNEKKERISITEAFHLIDKYWLRYREKDTKVREHEGVPGYIIWGEDIWNSFKANYIKTLDLHFFYSLESPLARRLYRFLDKRMQYQNKYEIDIFDLVGRLGMVDYAYPTWIKRKLQPGLDELIAKGFLTSAKVVKHKTPAKLYTRIRFVKASKKAPKTAAQPTKQYDDAQEETEAYQDRYTTQLNALRKHYGITEELVDIWEQALVEIKGAMTTANYQMWFPQTHLLSLKDGTAIVGTPNSFAQDWLSGRMTPVIKRALEGAVGHPVEHLSFQVLTLPKAKD